MSKIFISYRRNDSSDAAGRIYDRLASLMPKQDIFKDVDSIPYGSNFVNQIEQSVAQSSVMLVVIGPQWLGESQSAPNRLSEPQDFVRLEIELALQHKIPIIPVLVNRTSMPSATQLPESLFLLERVNAISVRPDPDFHTDMDRLVKAISLYTGPLVPTLTPLFVYNKKPLKVNRRKIAIAGIALGLISAIPAIILGPYPNPTDQDAVGVIVVIIGAINVGIIAFLTHTSGSIWEGSLIAFTTGFVAIAIAFIFWLHSQQIPVSSEIGTPFITLLISSLFFGVIALPFGAIGGAIGRNYYRNN